MIKELIELQKNSHAKYSNFKVAAIVVTNDNKKFNGVNVENSSFGETICAEKSALISAISNGYKKNNIKEIHLIGGDAKKIIYPCGSCLQVISELMSKDANIFLYSKKETKKMKINELLPFPFSEGDF